MVLRPGNIDSLKNSLSLEKWLMKNWKRRERSEEDIKDTLRRLWKRKKPYSMNLNLLWRINWKLIGLLLRQKLNVLGALGDEILALMTEKHIEDEIKETGNFRESIHQMIVEIDKFLNAVDLEKAGNTDKSIPLSNSNSFTERLGIRKAKLPKINLKKFYVIPFPSIHSGTHLQFIRCWQIQLFEKFVKRASRRSHSRATAYSRKLRVS